MRRASLLPIVAAALSIACGGPSVDANATLDELTYQEQEVPFVDADVLHAWMESGNADQVVFVDNRNAFAFQQQRIEDARLMSVDEVATSMGKLPVNKWAVFYCT